MVKTINYIFVILVFAGFTISGASFSFLGKYSFVPSLIFTPLLFVGVIFILALNYFATRKKLDERQAAMREFAKKHGWRYQEFATEEDLGILKHVVFYSGGLSEIRNLTSGKYRGEQAAIFDLISVTSSGSGSNRSSTWHYYTVFALRSKQLDLPVFYLYKTRPSLFNLEENFDIDFANRPVFSKNYLLYSKNNSSMSNFISPSATDEHLVELLFDDPLISYYEQNRFDFATAGGGNYLFNFSSVRDEATFINPENFAARLDRLIEAFRIYRESSNQARERVRKMYKV